MKKLALFALVAVSAATSTEAKHKPHPVAAPMPSATQEGAVPTNLNGEQLSLTIYNTNLALVQDQRHLDVPAGRSRIELKDVSAAIKPETVSLAGKGLETVEQNFDYDLLTPVKMMEKAVGKQIQIVRTNPGSGAQTTETATVLSVNGGVVLRIGNRIEVLRDDGVPTRVVFDNIPENLRARPTLSVTVDSQIAGPREAMLSYLTLGLSWKADYVAIFDERQGSLGLQGWATLTNKSGTSFRDVKTRLVAGNFNLSDDVNAYWSNARQQRSGNRNTGTGGSAPRTANDYYLYALPERVTIADNQTKQVSILDIPSMKATKAYEYRPYGFDGTYMPDHADVILEFANQSKALPAGVVRVYMRDEQGQPKFVGEDEIEHSPAGSDFGIKIGQAFDVTIEGTRVSSEKVGQRTRYSMSYVFRNARSDNVTVAMRQSELLRDAQIDSESQPSRRIDANTVEWNVTVPANGQTTLTFTAYGNG